MLVGRRAKLGVVLLWLSDQPSIARYSLGGRAHSVTPVKLVVAVLMIGFAVVERWGRFERAAVPPRYLPVGGLVSGFFGGLSGHPVHANQIVVAVMLIVVALGLGAGLL